MSELILKKATRSTVKLKIGLAGASGSGKTMSALRLAHGLVSDWTKIAVIDTENGSADLYSELGNYNTLTLTAPYTPERYIEALQLCEKAGMEVVIIDSMTHEWAGVGGCLEIQEKLGGRYQDWAKVKPRHRKFIDSILTSNCHVITTVRSKQDYAMDTENGKTKVTKLGLKQVTEDGLEYELTVSFELNQNHLASTSKDRTGVFMDQPEFVISDETGAKLKKWAESGKTLTPKQVEKNIVASTNDVSVLEAKMNMFITLAKGKGFDQKKALGFLVKKFGLKDPYDITDIQLEEAINGIRKFKPKKGEAVDEMPNFDGKVDSE